MAEDPPIHGSYKPSAALPILTLALAFSMLAVAWVFERQNQRLNEINLRSLWLESQITATEAESGKGIARLDVLESKLSVERKSVEDAEKLAALEEEVEHLRREIGALAAGIENLTASHSKLRGEFSEIKNQESGDPLTADPPGPPPP